MYKSGTFILVFECEVFAILSNVVHIIVSVLNTLIKHYILEVNAVKDSLILKFAKVIIQKNHCFCVLLAVQLIKGWGRGGDPDLGMVKIEFYVGPNREGPQLPDAFYRIKEYCS